MTVQFLLSIDDEGMTRVLLFAGVLLLSAFSLQALSSQAELQNSIVLNEVKHKKV
jgi:hypothetical protein